MKSLLITIFIILFAVIGNVVAIARVSVEREVLREKEGAGLVIPSAIAKVAALEFKGILADIIFSRAMTYYGGKAIRGEKVLEGEWKWIYESMDVATDLDNYFLDPYYFGAMNLAWEANKVKEANLLLEKALKYRDWDWTIPFYLGFNYFYFLQDDIKASKYLMEASKRPGSGDLLPTFAARLAYKGKRTENAVIFLEEIIKKTSDEHTRWIYTRRLDALKIILFLERGMAIYQDKFKKQPAKLNELITKGIIQDIPKDPYGGEFYIDKDSTIKTTSELR